VRRRPVSFYLLGLLVVALIAFLYAPTVTITILSFQGPNGGLTFPMNGASVHWFAELFRGNTGGDLIGSLQRSLMLAGMVMVASTTISLAAALYFRRRCRGSGLLLALVIAGLVVPSVLVGLGVGLIFSQIGIDPTWYESAFGAQLTWTLPFGVLVLIAVFNRFDRRWEEAARDLGASSWQVFWHVVLPIIIPGVVGVAMLSFSLSYDEFTRTALSAGFANTLPLEISSMTQRFTSPVLYALGSSTTMFSALVVALALAAILSMRSRRTTNRTQPAP
jgi:putative spermidine/putrescine transport system permease protein